MIRAKLVGMIPFLSRWFEVSSATTACCGVCPPCVVATASAVLLPLVIREHQSDTTGEA
jgi:hypothetical protein